MTLKKIQPVESVKSIYSDTGKKKNGEDEIKVVGSGEQVKRGKSSYGATRRSIGSLEDLQLEL